MGIDADPGRDLTGHVHEPRVLEDFMGGVRSGASGTPTFFTNGIRHVGPWDPDSLIEALSATAPSQVHA